MRRGFTLLETLAALVVLGLLATAASSFALQLGRAEARTGERWQARILLQTLRQGGVLPRQDGISDISGHPDWHLRQARLQEQGISDPTTSVPRAWRLVEIVSGSGESQRVLADLVMLEQEVP